MQITVDRAQLLNPLSKIVGITEHRAAMPVLSNVRITLGTERSFMTATDLDVSAIVKIDASTPPADLLVRGSVLLDILKAAEPGEINISVDDNTITLTQGTWETKLALQDVNEFPQVKLLDAGTQLRMKTKDLLDAIDKVEYAVSRDESRYVMTGVYFKRDKDNGKFDLVATDGFRLALQRQDVSGGVSSLPAVIMPGRAVSELTRIIEDEEYVDIAIADSMIQFTAPSATAISRTIEGVYPDYKGVVEGHWPNVMTVDREGLLKVLRKIQIMSDANIVTLTFKEGDLGAPGYLEITGSSDAGKAKEVMTATGYSGSNNPLSYNFKSSYLTAALCKISSDSVQIHFPDSHGGIFIGESLLSPHKNVVMPIHTA